MIIFYLVCALHGDYTKAETEGQYISEESCRARLDEKVSDAWRADGYRKG